MTYSTHDLHTKKYLTQKDMLEKIIKLNTKDIIKNINNVLATYRCDTELSKYEIMQLIK